MNKSLRSVGPLAVAVMVACGVSGLPAGASIEDPAAAAKSAGVAPQIAAFLAEREAGMKGGKKPEEFVPALADGVLKSVDVKALSEPDLRALVDAGIVRSATDTAAVFARLDTLAEEPGRAGLNAALTRMEARLGQRPTNEADWEVRWAAIRAVAGSDELVGAMSGPESDRVLRFAASFGSELEPDRLVKLAQGVPSKVSPAGASQLVEVFTTLLSLKDDVLAKDAREALRVRYAGLVKDTQSALGAAPAEAGSPGEQTARRLDAAAKFFDSPLAKGLLVGAEAPDLNFDWVSGGESFKGLDELKGKVVVLDFWATWCGPCVRSFPNVKKLVERYEGYPVEVIGVTSLQGRHIPTPGNGPAVDTKGDPQKEHQLMGEYITQNGLTWTIAFSKEPVFNPDYGIRGIPHLAIIDTKGVLRFRGLHPAMPLVAKAQMIDELLTEAGMKTPGPVAAEDGDAPAKGGDK
jgi:thiol-disulfide isomerase/thioredoxin